MPHVSDTLRLLGILSLHVWLSVATVEAQFLSATALPGDEVPVWERMPDLPDPLGVAGPIVGVHNGALIVAGGANFAVPVWESAKTWHDRIHVLTEVDGELMWIAGGRLEHPIGYGANVSLPGGVLSLGGNDATDVFAEVRRLRWEPRRQVIEIQPMASLPEPRAYGHAAAIGDVVYFVGGQSGATLESCTASVWSLDLSSSDRGSEPWELLPPVPAAPRAFHLTATQHDGREVCLFVISGRTQSGDATQFLTDVWKYSPGQQTWTACADIPRCVMAGTAVSLHQDQILVLGGADGSLFFRTDELRDRHPGFPKEAWAYNTVTDTWSSAGSIPSNHVTTTAVWHKDRIVIPSGEIRPRVRTPAVWAIHFRE